MENFKISFQDFVKNPYTAILLTVGGFAFYLNTSLISAKNEELSRKNIEFEKCQLELERRNRILEEIVFNQKIKKDAK
jgi:hypothetical protein